MTTVPTWVESDYRQKVGQALTPLERFIYDHSPASSDDEQGFRAQLLVALNEAWDAGNWASGQIDGPGYAEPENRIYGHLTPQQIKVYQDEEERRNCGN